MQTKGKTLSLILCQNKTYHSKLTQNAHFPISEKLLSLTQINLFTGSAIAAIVRQPFNHE
jgi:hypothetical protein